MSCRMLTKQKVIFVVTAFFLWEIEEKKRMYLLRFYFGKMRNNCVVTRFFLWETFKNVVIAFSFGKWKKVLLLHFKKLKIIFLIIFEENGFNTIIEDRLKGTGL